MHNEKSVLQNYSQTEFYCFQISMQPVITSTKNCNWNIHNMLEIYYNY